MAWESRPRPGHPPVPNAAYHEPATTSRFSGPATSPCPLLKNDLFIDVAVAAEVDDVRTILVELTKKIDEPRPRDNDQFQDAAELPQTDFLIDLSEFSMEIEGIGVTWIGGEEQDLDLLHENFLCNNIWSERRNKIGFLSMWNQIEIRSTMFRVTFFCRRS